jgi:hypothetical protein
VRRDACHITRFQPGPQLIRAFDKVEAQYSYTAGTSKSRRFGATAEFRRGYAPTACCSSRVLVVLGYCLKSRIDVGGDPRPIAVEIPLGWDKSEEEPRTWWESFRGVSTRVEASDLFDGVLKTATLFVEGESTRQGHQQFRVTHAEWHSTEQRNEEPGE